MKPVDLYIQNLPNHKREAVTALMQYIAERVPEADLNLNYGIPYSYMRKPLCYLNSKENGIDLGFHKGQNLNSPHLLKTGRKWVASLFFSYDQE